MASETLHMIYTQVGSAVQIQAVHGCRCTTNLERDVHVHDLINEPQPPWLQTAIHHMGLDVENESHSVHRTHFCQYQASSAVLG